MTSDPLNNSGDAFGLAAKRRIDIQFWDGFVSARAPYCNPHYEPQAEGEDIEATARRAIVRCVGSQ
jgi:hypothetical protein